MLLLYNTYFFLWHQLGKSQSTVREAVSSTILTTVITKQSLSVNLCIGRCSEEVTNMILIFGLTHQSPSSFLHHLDQATLAGQASVKSRSLTYCQNLFAYFGQACTKCNFDTSVPENVLSLNYMNCLKDNFIEYSLGKSILKNISHFEPKFGELLNLEKFPSPRCYDFSSFSKKVSVHLRTL